MTLFKPETYKKNLTWPSIATLLVMGGTRTFIENAYLFQPTSKLVFDHKNFAMEPTGVSSKQKEKGRQINIAYHIWWAYHVVYPRLSMKTLTYVLSKEHYEEVLHEQLLSALNKFAG